MTATWEGGEPVIKHDGHLPVVGELELDVNYELMAARYGVTAADWKDIVTIATADDVEYAAECWATPMNAMQSFTLLMNPYYGGGPMVKYADGTVLPANISNGQLIFSAKPAFDELAGKIGEIKKAFEAVSLEAKKSLKVVADSLFASVLKDVPVKFADGGLLMVTLPDYDAGPSNDTLVLQKLAKRIPGMQEPIQRPCQHLATEKVISVVIHLNDIDRWTREQIADWLDTLDIDLSVRDAPVYASTGVLTIDTFYNMAMNQNHVRISVAVQGSSETLVLRIMHDVDDGEILKRIASFWGRIEDMLPNLKPGQGQMFGREVQVSKAPFLPDMQPRSFEEALDAYDRATAHRRRMVDLVAPSGFKDIYKGPGDVPELIGSTHCPVTPDFDGMVEQLKKLKAEGKILPPLYPQAW